MQRILTVLGISALVLGCTVAPAKDNETGAAIVKIIVDGGHGSGFYIGRGILITAAHVVKGDKDGKVNIKLPTDEEIEGEVLWINEARDVAAIKVEPNVHLKAATLRCDEPDTGEKIYAEGSPVNMEFVTVWGAVAGKARNVGPWKWAFVTNIAVAGGQSGGPVYNMDREIIGMTVGGMLMSMGMNSSLTGIGYAVPGSTICEVLGR